MTPLLTAMLSTRVRAIGSAAGPNRVSPEPSTTGCTEYEQCGDALEAAVVLSVVGEGIPLIYSGQEAGSDRRLPLFEKDAIDWQDHAMGRLYQRLFALKKRHPALWNGAWGAPTVPVRNSADTSVLSFVRSRRVAGEREDTVFAVFNLSEHPQRVVLGDGPFDGSYRDALTDEVVDVRPGVELLLPPWAPLVLTT